MVERQIGRELTPRHRARSAVIALLLAAGSIAASAATPLATPAATPRAATLRLRIVGGLAGVNQYTKHEEPFWTTELPRLSGGAASAEIVPFDRTGIRPEEMLNLVRLGAVPFGTALLTISALDLPELFAPDLAGLNPDITALRRTVGAYRPQLRSLLHDRYDAELLALYVYPAQVTFCKQPLKGLDDLRGRRVRVANSSQSDWISALGGIPVQTSFSEIMGNIKSGNVECAITGTMSGNTIGLDQVTRYIHTMPISWGIAAFVANGRTWETMPIELKTLLQRELPRLEQEIWDESARETGEGIACNSGSDRCVAGRKGTMIVVPLSEADERRRMEVLTRNVLPAWIRRCGPQCLSLWQQAIGPVVGIDLK